MSTTTVQEPVRTPLPETQSRNLRWIAYAVIVAVCCFHLATLRAGHGWSGDFSLYILHARNIAEGQPYGETPFVYNERFLSHSPRSYPPVYPLLLAPVYALYGLDYTPMKVLTYLFLPLSWLLLLRLNGISDRSRVMLIAMSAACPIFWRFKDWVIPDFVFMALLILTMWLNQRAYSTGDDRNRPLREGLLIAVAMAAAYGTRSSGVVLPLAVAGYDIVRNRRLTAYAVTAVAGFGLLVLTMNAVAGRSEQSYMAQFAQFSAARLAGNAIEYVRSFAHIWYTDQLKFAQYVMFGVAAIAAIAGFASRTVQWVSAVELFFAGHLAVLILWPGASGDRYILPMIPFFLFYVMAGFERLRWKHAAAVFAGLTLTLYAMYYLKADYGPLEDGPRQASFQEMTRFVEQSTEARDLHVFWNPRVLALYTGVRSMTYGPDAAPGVNWRDFVRKGVRYLVVYLRNSDDARVLGPIVRDHAGEVEPVWNNQDYVVYRITAGQPK